jgi:hypothetical protein
MQVDEVVEPSVFVLHPGREEAKRYTRPIDRAHARHPAALGGDAHPAQAKAYRRDAADIARTLVARRSAVGRGAIADDASGWVRLFPEKQEGALRHVLQERIISSREAECRWRGSGRRWWCRDGRAPQQGHEQRQQPRLRPSRRTCGARRPSSCHAWMIW